MTDHDLADTLARPSPCPARSEPSGLPLVYVCGGAELCPGCASRAEEGGAEIAVYALRDGAAVVCGRCGAAIPPVA